MATENAFPKTLQQAIVYFSDPDVCLQAAIAMRWQGQPVTCPTCGSQKVHFIATRRIWRCSEIHSRRQFSVKVGTVMEDSPIGLDKWMTAIWLISNAKNGISSYELHRAIGITQKSAWFLLHRIRLILQDRSSGGKLGGDVEADETYIGGKARNMHYGRRKEVLRGRGPSKVAVMGLLERTKADRVSKVRAHVVKNIRRNFIQGEVRKHVETGSNLYTDALSSYQGLDLDYVHNVIDHAEMYAKDNVHTNGLENFWSLLKRTIKGTYVSVEPFHLFRYLDEQCYRFNNRDLNDSERFIQAARSIVGRRVMYKTLTGHDLPESRTN